VKTLDSNAALALCYGYVFEAALLCILWLDVPVIAPVAGLLQMPSALLGLGIPPPAIAPNGTRDIVVLMFIIQGLLFSVVALGIKLVSRRFPKSRVPDDLKGSG
jgi:hypothetical protein